MQKRMLATKFKGATIMQNNKQVQSYSAGFKNLVIGFLLGMCLTLAIAATSTNDDSLGPYQCCSAGNDPACVFVVNTQTGHTWRLSRADHYDFGTPQQRKSIRSSVTPMVD
jgi:hypothetical protein